MNGHWKWVACAAIVIGAAALASAQESLGDFARKERTRQKPQAAKVITNDDIPSVETPAPSPDTKDSPDKNAKDPFKPLTAEDKIKQTEQWRSRIAAQEAKVQALDREINQMERDYKVRMSAFYADLGMRLRDQNKWAADEKKYHDEIAAKQKAREEERTKLQELKEQGRRAGVEGID
jgi:hypothetical protein